MPGTVVSVSQHFVGFGHSNAWCVASASKSWSSELGTTFEFDVVGSKAFPGGLTVRANDGRPIASPLIIAAIERAQRQHGGAVALSFCFGNHYNAIGLLEGRFPLELVHPDAPDPIRADNAILVPHQLVIAQIRARIVALEELFAILTASGTRVVHVEGPPPTSDATLIDKTVERARAQVPDARAAPPELRRRLWLCQRDATAAMCRETGVEYLVPPPSTQDDQGFLLDRFAKDGVHGNGAYGRHMLAWIEETVTADTLLGAR